MNKSKIILIILLSIGCQNTNNEINEYLTKSEEYRKSNQLREAIIELRNLIKKYPKHKLASESQFMIAEIYLNDVKDFQFAIEEFKKVYNLYPNSKESAKSQFMIGYIYANYLQSYSDALEYYYNFIKKYPKHELKISVEYEINELKKYETIIDSLNNISKKIKEIS